MEPELTIQPLKGEEVPQTWTDLADGINIFGKINARVRSFADYLVAIFSNS